MPNYRPLKILAALAAPILIFVNCTTSNNDSGDGSTSGATGPAVPTNDLPQPIVGEKVYGFCKVTDWPQGTTPQAPAGFKVTRFAEGFDHPRWLYQLPNGDILVAEANTEPKPPPADLTEDQKRQLTEGRQACDRPGKSANRITVLRDSNRDGVFETRQTFVSGLKQNFGMLLLGDQFYVANTDSLLKFPYKTGDLTLAGSGEKILDLPAGGYNNHWTRNLIAKPDGSKIYISIGSASNVAEHGIEEERRRANILEINPDGSGERIFASGLRNPVGMEWSGNTLYTAVNERDELGDELVPDYLTSVRENGFYGWPYSYYGNNEDPRRAGERPDLVEDAIIPDVALGSHTASLGLEIYKGEKFPQKYRGGAFIGQRGSWNRSQLAGYKVVFVPFANGRPSGPPEDFLTGFIKDPATREVNGRPVGILELQDGSILVTDDVTGIVWRVSAE